MSEEAVEVDGIVLRIGGGDEVGAPRLELISSVFYSREYVCETEPIHPYYKVCDRHDKDHVATAWVPACRDASPNAGGFASCH